MYNLHASAILHTNTSHSVTKPSEYAQPETSTTIFLARLDYLGRKTGVIIAAQTYGLDTDGGWDIGTRHSFIADQSSRSLGEMEVIGFHNSLFGSVGEVPTRKVNFYVFK
jgi:hypothetical protein